MSKGDATGMPYHKTPPDLQDLDAAYVLMDLANSTGYGFNYGCQDAIITSESNHLVNDNASSAGSSTFDTEGFSSIHFLSAIRVVLTSPVAAPNKHCPSTDGSESAKWRLPAFTTQEIVRRVRLMPGDARILDQKLRLEDLVRGVLRIFSSHTAPPGVSSWKSLTMYKRNNKSWSWIGPIPTHPLRPDDHDIIITSPEAWGLNGQAVEKLADCFSEWLAASMEVLQKIASLPPPPLQFMQPARSSERFSSSRNLKTSVCTIGRSCDRVRAYFQTEEALRYLIPERPFSYTTIDGRKSSVAPFRRCSGKPSRKARDHFILKPNRPPCFTVLSLVRDAASRLPEGLGTRSDICNLVRDSGYIMEEVSDYKIEHVVSGALDRLHYERDPCVKFDRESRLWIYLHGNREEEDFEDDGTSSKKIRRKHKTKR